MPKFAEFRPAEELIGDYLERFEIFLRVNAVKPEDKVDHLLHYISRVTYNVLKNLLIPESPSGKTCEELVTMLKAHYAPKRLLITEGVRFHKRNQEPDEPSGLCRGVEETSTDMLLWKLPR